jgi:hypothetical protein
MRNRLGAAWVLSVITAGMGLGCSTSDTNAAPTGDDTGSSDDTGQVVDSAPTDDSSPSDAGDDSAPDSPVTPPAAGDLGFRPKPDGFKFENYGGDPAIQNLAPANLRALFGDAVCASLAGGTCTLTPAGQAWLDSQNKGMSGGHCEGFAVLSLLFFTKALSPSDFGAASTFDLDLASNAKLQNEIARWFVTQGTDPTTSAVKRMSASQVLDALAASFASPSADKYTLGIYKADMTDGHAITPYKLVDKGGGAWDIGVYDNNWPGEERVVSVDRNANTWKYFASTSPSVAGSEYNGTATTNNLDLTPTSARLKPQICPFCGNAAADGTVTPPTGMTLGSKRQLILSGSGHLTASSASGTIGWMGGSFVNTLAGGAIVPVKGRDLWSTDTEPEYLVPTGEAMTITIDGTSLSAMSPTSLSMVMPAFELGVDGILLDPMQKDTIRIDKSGLSIGYETAGMETPAVRLGVTTPLADWSFDVVSSGEAAGQQVQLTLDMTKQRLAMVVKGSSSTSAYDIFIDRIDDVGVQTFHHAGDALAPTDTIYFNYGAWGGNGMTMLVEVDVNSDGTIDRTYTLTDVP